MESIFTKSSFFVATVFRLMGVAISAGTFFAAKAQFMPTISSISPTSGPPGTTVTITGQNFVTNNMVVYFNGIRGTNLNIISGQSLTVRVPHGAQSGFVTVVNTTANTLRQFISTQQFLVTYNGGSVSAATFNARVNFTTGASSAPSLIKLADMDGDGKLDILTARNNLPLGILRNTHIMGMTPSFAAPVTLSNENNTQSFEVQDFNSDGTIDVFQTLNGANVLQGVGVANYSTAGNIVGGPSAVAGGVQGPNQPMRGTAVGDMGSPRDGKPDILWVYEANTTVNSSFVNTNQNTSSFSSIVNRQIVSFSSNSPIIISGNFKRCWDTEAADFDGDGLVDVATYETGTGGTNNLIIRRNAANGGFSITSNFNIALGVASPQSGRMVISDIDQDGKIDIILAVSNVSLRIYRNTSTAGNLSFALAGNFAPGTSSYANYTVADITGDGLPDLIMARNFTSGGAIEFPGNVTIIPNTTTGSTIAFGTQIQLTGPAATDVAVGDVNNDGFPDIITSSALTHGVNVYMNAMGTIPAPAISEFTPSSGTTGTTVSITGQNFTGTVEVRFNGIAAQSFTVVSATQITAVVPGPGTTGPISVVTPGGTAQSATNFNFFNLPSISSFTPRQAPSRGTITIFGGNLNQVTEVRIGGRQANFSLVNNATITAGVPSNATTGSVAIVAGTNGPIIELPGFTFVNAQSELEACTANPLALTAPVTGLTYQWQADSFNGFTNLTDGTLVTGTNTPTLNLIGANPSFTGYRFRCVVNSVPQAPVTLRYYTYFTGTLGNAWNNAANWSCGVPTIQMDAVFTGSVNLIGSANEVRKAHVRPGASVTLAPGATLLIAE